MIPRRSVCRLTGLRIPRESGDDPAVILLMKSMTEYSPRERG